MQVRDADIEASRMVMSQYAQEAKPTANEKKKPASLPSSDLTKHTFIHPFFFPQHGCRYKLNATTDKVISFDATCIVYAVYYYSALLIHNKTAALCWVKSMTSSIWLANSDGCRLKGNIYSLEWISRSDAIIKIRF
jgi:hypothetical protein